MVDARIVFHVAKNIESGVETLCARLEMFAVYPSELARYSSDPICSECEQLHGTEPRR
jgi:hypothetical protein